jgi:hypothetical protein
MSTPDFEIINMNKKQYFYQYKQSLEQVELIASDQKHQNYTENEWITRETSNTFQHKGCRRSWRALIPNNPLAPLAPEPAAAPPTARASGRERGEHLPQILMQRTTPPSTLVVTSPPARSRTISDLKPPPGKPPERPPAKRRSVKPPPRSWRAPHEFLPYSSHGRSRGLNPAAPFTAPLGATMRGGGGVAK